MRGDKGIALIHRIVNDMGFVWNAFHLEVGDAVNQQISM
jgi:hypothetical protein